MDGTSEANINMLVETNYLKKYWNNISLKRSKYFSKWNLILSSQYLFAVYY